jgi:small subunit ribosomal protein S16
MATRIRLRRMGSKGRPFYRVVVADQRAPRDGRFIENIGKYHPLSDPSLIEIDEERALYWLRVGAQPSNQVRNLMSKLGIWETFVKERPSATVGVKTKTERPAKEKLSKKAQAKAAEFAKAAAPKPAPVEESAVAAEAATASAEEAAAESTEVAVEETPVEETAEA